MTPLPAPNRDGVFAVEKALAQRRSKRAFVRKPITVGQLSQLLWAAQGITDPESGFRSAPSAGALYPLELYVVARKDGVDGLHEGVYHYEPRGHRLTLLRDGDSSSDLEAATWDQEIVNGAAATIVITGVFSRTTEKYGRRGNQYVFQESGHAAQNVFLQATALGLGTVVMGAFSMRAVSKTIGLERGETPLCLLPIGTPAQG